MKVIRSEESLLEFDNGLQVLGNGEEDCCANNYLDFEQFPVGLEFDDMTIGKFLDSMTVKEDGFSIKDSYGIPKWAQARSEQNGYYSNITTLILKQNENTVEVKNLEGKMSDG